MRDAFSLYFYYCKTSKKAWFQYRVDAFLRIFAVMARESTAVIIMYITFLSFKNIGGWTINELLFLFSFMFLTYGIFIIFEDEYIKTTIPSNPWPSAANQSELDARSWNNTPRGLINSLSKSPCITIYWKSLNPVKKITQTSHIKMCLCTLKIQ